jgi:hypothetical protein
VELKDLVGEHVLDAVDFSNEQVRTWGDNFEDAQVIRFRLDGICYIATEDPDDGYRSSMQDIVIAEVASMANTFPPVRVVCRHRTEGRYSNEDDILEFIDMETGKVVLEVGTDNSDDYYPSFVACFKPENMHINDISSPQPSPNAAANE